MRMEIFMRESGNRIRHMDSEYSRTLMAQCIKGTGKKTNKRVRARRLGQMGLPTKAITFKE